MTHNSPARDAAVLDALSTMSLEDKVKLLTGRDLWSTWPIDSSGIRRIVMSDGPSGVRGEVWDERDPSLNLPSATALASSWDRSVAKRYGACAAVEARRKGVDVVLGPTINLHRSPLAGRHFECLSEDPVLTADLAAAYVTGVQENGVGATPKHYVANDSETERFTVNAVIDERTLREVYLMAFEKAITEARSWLVMSAYNSVNGATMSENTLLETPLKTEWGFDGVVVSDWTAVRTLDSARASQDLAMPGPDGPWGTALLEMVRAGELDESVIDDKVERILRLALRVGALSDHSPTDPVWVEDGVAFAREAAADGTVLLENRNELPWDAAAIKSVAVIGHNAMAARTQGGGSATVVPERTVSPLEGISTALPRAEVSYSLGATVQEHLSELPLEQLVNPATGSPGVHVRLIDTSGATILTEQRQATHLVYFGGDIPIDRAAVLELTTRFTPNDSEAVRLGFSTVGHGQLWVEDSLLLDENLRPGEDVASGFLNPPTTSAPVTLVSGRPVELRFVYRLTEREGISAHAISLRIGTQPVDVDDDALIDEAATAAAAADVALVVVGTNSLVESEGHDRTTLALPGRQDDLVRAVARANPRTVVLVNAGSPVLLPWRHEVAALLVGYFGGQEFGNAIADVLLGSAEPGGRLPTTWPVAEYDAPVLNTTPADGSLKYDEGIHIGYRAWLRHYVEPAYWFGAGHGYADIAVTRLQTPAGAVRAGDVVTVSVDVRNRSSRAGKAVVQVYASRPVSAIDRPARWLVGFATARVAGGQTASVDIAVPIRLLAHWDRGWQYEPGEYKVHAGFSVVEVPLMGTLTLV